MHFRSLKDGSYVLNVVYLESTEHKELQRMKETSVKSYKMICLNLFMLTWQHTIVVVCLVLLNF